MVGHTEAVSALISNGSTLTSGGHEGSIRVWDLRKRQCLFDLFVHRRKFDEGVKALAPRNGKLASAGADGLVKIMTAFEQV